MKPHMTLDVPSNYDGRGDHRLGTLTCHQYAESPQCVMTATPTYEKGRNGVVDQRLLQFPIYTRASYDDAEAHDNPTADPTRPYGNMPRGLLKIGPPIWKDETYEGDRLSRPGDHDGMIAKYGWGRMGPVFIPLLPVASSFEDYAAIADALTAHWDAYHAFRAVNTLPARSGLGLHGGPLARETSGDYIMRERLNCTNGGGRGYDDDVVQVAKWVERVLPTVDELYAIVRGQI